MQSPHKSETERLESWLIIAEILGESLDQRVMQIPTKKDITCGVA
jgi:hypothetical protein